jgi:adenosylcobinamide-GDP ribazoletransferase
LKRLLLAITFLTRLPLPIPKNITNSDMGRSTPFFPLVGLIIGLMLVGIDRIFSLILPSIVVNAIIFISLIVITGGLHLDGLMDTCDGIFSGRDRERILEIMRDSRVGAFGVLGAICIVVLKLSLLNTLPVESKYTALILFPVMGRWGMVWAVVLFPYARKTPGLGVSFTDFARKSYIIWSMPFILIISIPLLLWWSISIIIVTGLSAWLTGKWLSHKLGGLTGDTYGAICEVTEVLTLMMIYIIRIESS